MKNMPNMERIWLQLWNYVRNIPRNSQRPPLASPASALPPITLQDALMQRNYLVLIRDPRPQIRIVRSESRNPALRLMQHAAETRTAETHITFLVARAAARPALVGRGCGWGSRQRWLS